MSSPDCQPPTHDATWWEGGRRVTGWTYQAWTVHGGYRVCKARWVLTPEGWDQERGEFMHEVPFETQLQADAVAAALNGPVLRPHL